MQVAAMLMDMPIYSRLLNFKKQVNQWGYLIF